MKVQRTIHHPQAKVDALIEKLARQDAHGKAKSGKSYRKVVAGMNGAKQTVTVTVHTLEPGCYSVSFEGKNGTTDMTYQYSPIDDQCTLLTYEEVAHGEGVMQTLNQKLGSLLFGMSAKKQMKMRLDAFEKALEEMEWPD